MCDVETQPSRSMLRIVKFDKFDACMILLMLLVYALVAVLPVVQRKKLAANKFHLQAKIVAQVLRGSTDWRDINISRAPGPVLYYAVPYSLLPVRSTDNSYRIVGLMWTIGLVCMSMLLIRRAAAYLGDDLSGRLTAIIVLLTPFPVYYSFSVGAEPMAFVSSALACYAWAK